MQNKLMNLSQSATLANAINAVVNRSCIVDFGIVKEVPAPGIVTVELAVARKPQEVKVITCVLANIAANAFTLDITPETGDKVLVVYPKRFSVDMFDTEKDEVIIDETASGYNLFSGIAILLNQYRKNQHMNKMLCKEDGITLELGYDEDSEVNNTTVNIAKNGAMTLQTGYNSDAGQYNNDISISEAGIVAVKTAYDKDKGAYKNVIDLTDTGAFKFTVGDNFIQADLSSDGTVSLTDSNGMSMETSSDGVTIDVNGKAEVKIDSSGNVIIDSKNGKLSLKNTAGGSLFDILDGMLQVLNTNLATQGSPAAHTVVPGQFAQQKTKLGMLMQ